MMGDILHKPTTQLNVHTNIAVYILGTFHKILTLVNLYI